MLSNTQNPEDRKLVLQEINKELADLVDKDKNTQEPEDINALKAKLIAAMKTGYRHKRWDIVPQTMRDSFDYFLGKVIEGIKDSGFKLSDECPFLSWQEKWEKNNLFSLVNSGVSQDDECDHAVREIDIFREIKRIAGSILKNNPKTKSPETQDYKVFYYQRPLRAAHEYSDGAFCSNDKFDLPSRLIKFINGSMYEFPNENIDALRGNNTPISIAGDEKTIDTANAMAKALGCPNLLFNKTETEAKPLSNEGIAKLLLETSNKIINQRPEQQMLAQESTERGAAYKVLPRGSGR